MSTIEVETLRSWLEADKPVVVLDVRSAADPGSDIVHSMHRTIPSAMQDLYATQTRRWGGPSVLQIAR